MPRYYYGHWTLGRLIVGCAIPFLVSMVMSCQELRYLAWGKTTEAQIVKDQVERDPGLVGSLLRTSSSSWPKRRMVIYTFMDGENLRKEYEKVPMDWSPPSGQTIQIQYIAGKENQSRFAGTHHWGWITLFIASLAAMAATLGWMVRSTR